jgi:pimeloyl-ACP methyl ester carboxylesterase
MATRAGRRVAAALVAGLVLVACVGDSDDTADRASTTAEPAPSTSTPASDPTTTSPPLDPAPLTWESCGGAGRVECARLPVPVDWADPTGPTVELAVARRPATDPAARLGVVVFNPGGPGASGVDQIVAGPAVDDEVAQRFDLVAWDTRGTGDSARLTCDDTAARWLAADPSPDGQDEWRTLDDLARTLADECARVHGDLLPHLDTGSTVQDMEHLRRALGEEQLSYVGSSYGTLIGQLYADEHPDRVRAMVLDGLVDPSLEFAGVARSQAVGIESHLDRLLASCAGACAGDPAATLDAVEAQVDVEPISSATGTLGPAELTLATVITAYAPSTWSTYLRGLDAAAAGDPAPLVELAERYTSITEWAPYVAVLCLDGPHPSDLDGFVRLADELDDIAPRVGTPLAVELLACTHWPADASREPAPIVAAGAPPILLLSTTGDGVTPPDQARAVAESLASGVLVTIEGEGHGAIGRRDCVDALVARYLVDLVVPPVGTAC